MEGLRPSGRSSLGDIAPSCRITLPSRAFRYTVLATMFSNSISSSLTVYDHLGPALTLSHSSQDATQGGVLRGNMARTPRLPTLPTLLPRSASSSRPPSSSLSHSRHSALLPDPGLTLHGVFDAANYFVRYNTAMKFPATVISSGWASIARMLH